MALKQSDFTSKSKVKGWEKYIECKGKVQERMSENISLIQKRFEVSEESNVAKVLVYCNRELIQW